MTSRGRLLALVSIVVAGVVVLSFFRFEGGSPEIAVEEDLLLGAEKRTLRIELSDFESGLRSFEVRLQSASGTRSLYQEEFPGSLLAGGAPDSDRATLELLLDPELLRLPDGNAKVTMTARDWSWKDGFAGNRTDAVVRLVVDTKPPTISAQSGLTYIYRGGAAAVTYRVDSDSAWDGVQVGDAYFSGFALPGASDPALRVVLLAVPVESTGSPPINLVARDAAENETRTSFPARILERRFPDSNISLSTPFLRNVAVPLAEAHGLASDDPVVAFQLVNRDLRAANEARIREAIGGSSPEILWDGAFAQMKNSKVTSRFAEFRTYVADGQEVSTARHYGFDLASTSGAEITASNSGRVALAEDLGIYGNCVIIDHGLGLATLYGHLSQIDVAVDDRVAKHQVLGRSGATGLAGGDHLHFAILVGGAYVDPMEWWDAQWVNSHVTVRLGP